MNFVTVMQQAHAALMILYQCGTVFDPVAAVRVAQTFFFTQGRVVDMPADNAVITASFSLGNGFPFVGCDRRFSAFDIAFDQSRERKVGSPE